MIFWLHYIAVWPFVVDHRGFRVEFSSNVGAVNCKLNAPEAQLFLETDRGVRTQKTTVEW